MDKRSLRRRRFFIFLLSAALLTPKVNATRGYVPQYSICEEKGAYGKYRNGYVYIGSKEDLEAIRDKVGENDILVLDDRFSDDPDMMIYNSYRISDSDEREDILNILEAYEEEYPSDWERTIDSMRTEWAFHNIFYNHNWKLSHTTDVDLNNNDELLFRSKMLKLFFH